MEALDFLQSLCTIASSIITLIRIIKLIKTTEVYNGIKSKNR